MTISRKMRISELRRVLSSIDFAKSQLQDLGCHGCRCELKLAASIVKNYIDMEMEIASSPICQEVKREVVKEVVLPPHHNYEGV